MKTVMIIVAVMAGGDNDNMTLLFPNKEACEVVQRKMIEAFAAADKEFKNYNVICKEIGQ